MTRMLQSMKHRGPDSTGYALYRPHDDHMVMRYKLADSNTPRDFEFSDRLDRHQDQVIRASRAWAPTSTTSERTEYAYRVAFTFERNLKELADRIEDIPTARCSRSALARDRQGSRGRRGGRRAVRPQGLQRHARDRPRPHGHESDVDISGAHPYWAYPFTDVAVVHNGQLTNYFQWKRRLERRPPLSRMRLEIIAVYLAEKMSEGASLEDAMRDSLEELDGVFTYIAVTEDALGVCKDEMAAKPLVLYESDGIVALASEEIAIRAVVDHEVDTYDRTRAR